MYAPRISLLSATRRTTSCQVANVGNTKLVYLPHMGVGCKFFFFGNVGHSHNAFAYNNKVVTYIGTYVKCGQLSRKAQPRERAVSFYGITYIVFIRNANDTSQNSASKRLHFKQQVLINPFFRQCEP